MNHWYLINRDGTLAGRRRDGKIIRFTTREAAEAIANLIGNELTGGKLQPVSLELDDQDCTEADQM